MWELADEPDPLTPSLVEARLGFIVFLLITVISNGPRAGYPGRSSQTANGSLQRCESSFVIVIRQSILAIEDPEGHDSATVC